VIDVSGEMIVLDFVQRMEMLQRSAKPQKSGLLT